MLYEARIRSSDIIAMSLVQYAAVRCTNVRTRFSKRRGRVVRPRTMYCTVFQLGLFLRALRPANTGLRPARFTRVLPKLEKKKLKKKNYFYKM